MPRHFSIVTMAGTARQPGAERTLTEPGRLARRDKINAITNAAYRSGRLPR